MFTLYYMVAFVPAKIIPDRSSVDAEERRFWRFNLKSGVSQIR